MAVVKVDANGNFSFDNALKVAFVVAEYSPIVLLGKAALSVFSQESLNDKIAGNIERIIKSGKDNGVDCLEIQCEKTIGLTAKMKQYGATLAAGSSGSTVIKVRYK